MNSLQNFAPIAALDFEPIKVKLMHKESGEGWSRAHANAVEFEYRRFLYLLKRFPDVQVAPPLDVDMFWHHHILNTMKYAADCEQIFGYFLHHCPSVETQGEDDEAVHDRSGARMLELYEATFGEVCIRPQESNLITTSAADSTWCSPALTQTAWCTPTTAITTRLEPAAPTERMLS